MKVAIYDENKQPYMVRLEDFHKNVVSFGRIPDNDIRLSPDYVSRVHGNIVKDSGGWVIEDAGSTYGMLCNGAQIKKMRLYNNACVRIQSGQHFVELRFMEEKAEQKQPVNQVQKVSVVSSPKPAETETYQGNITKLLLIPYCLVALIILISGISMDVNYGTLGWATASAIIVDIFDLIPIFVYVFCGRLAFTNKRISGKTGFIKIRFMESTLDQVDSVNVSNGLLGKLFDYGTVHIVTTNSSYWFRGIIDPYTFADKLMETEIQVKNL